MLKIDIHTHILPERIPHFAKKFGYGDFITLDHHQTGCARMLKGEHFFREIEANSWDARVRLNECDSHGVDIQVLSTVPVMFNYWAKGEDALEVSKFLNDHIAETVSSTPRRFVGLGTLPMQDPDLAVRELGRCVEELNLLGVEIGSHVNEWNLDHERLFPVFEAAQHLSAAVFVHPWDMLAPERMDRYWLQCWWGCRLRLPSL